MIGSTVSHNFNLQSAAEPANPEATHAISYIHICTLAGKGLACGAAWKADCAAD